MAAANLRESAGAKKHRNSQVSRRQSLPPLFSHQAAAREDVSGSATDAFVEAATAFPNYAPRTQVNVTSVAEDPAILPGLFADIMGQIGDALALVDDSSMTSVTEAWVAQAPAADHRTSSATHEWTATTEPQVPISEQLLSPAAQHRSELARHYAQAAAVAFATPAAAANYTPPPLPAHKYPLIKRSNFAGHVTRLRQARVQAGLPATPLSAAAPPVLAAPTPQASTSAAPAAVTAASHVPAMFFSREYRLNTPATFKCILGGAFGETLGSQQASSTDPAASQEQATAALQAAQRDAPDVQSLRVSPALQHTLSNFLDFVEGDLATRITGRKEQLFSALHTLHALWDSVVVANNAVVATRERVARSRRVLSRDALQVLALKRRQQRAQALKRQLLQLRELATQKKSIARMLSRGSHASALSACRALRRSVAASLGELKCSSSVLDGIAALEAATADAVSQQFNRDAMVVVSGALDASSALHILSRGSLSSAGAAAVKAYVQGWQSSHSTQHTQQSSNTPSETSSLLQVLAWSGPLGCESALLQFVLRRQLATLGSLGAGTLQACLETFSGKVAREVKALISTEVCEGVRVLELREAAASATWQAEGEPVEGSGNPFGYDWESVGGDKVSISTVQRLTFTDFCDMLTSLLVALHRCLRRVSRVHALLLQVVDTLRNPTSSTESAILSEDDAAALILLSRDVVVSATGTAQKQVTKLLRARRTVHTSLKVHQMGALMLVCDAFATSCATLGQDFSPSDGIVAEALGGSELLLEATGQVEAAMKTLHTRNMTSLPALLNSEVWKAVVAVQPTFHSLVLGLCVPAVLGGAQASQALPDLRRALAAQPSTLADELAKSTLSRAGEVVNVETAGEACLLSALGQALPLRCVASWPQLGSATEATSMKLDVYLTAEDDNLSGAHSAASSAAGAPSGLVSQRPSPPATKRLHVPHDVGAGVTVVSATAQQAQLQIEVTPFTVVSAALMLVKMMDDYVSAARLMPHAVSGDAAVKLAELLRKFNTTTTHLVLNGGAVTNGTLKTIFAKHLAATATSLRAVSCLLPAIRSSFSCLLPAAQHGMLKDLWRVGQDLDKHVERIFDKFSTILQSTFAQSLENIGSVDWNKHADGFDAVYPRLVRDAVQHGALFVTSTPSESSMSAARSASGAVWEGFQISAAPPTRHMRDVIKNTETLHRIISASLSNDDLCRVFSSVAVMLSAQLPVIVVSAQYDALSPGRPDDGATSDEGLSDYGNKRLAWDVVSLLVMLRRVPGLGVHGGGVSASAHEELTAGQVALTSIESWVKRQFGVVLSSDLYVACGVAVINSAEERQQELPAAAEADAGVAAADP